MMSHNSAQVPEYAAACQESQSFKRPLKLEDVINLKNVFAQMSRAVRRICLVKKIEGLVAL